VNVFAAKYAGICGADECTYGDRKISVGDAVAYDSDDDLCHEACAKRAVRHDDTQCGECGLYHRGQC
jgi:hypothetical protein